MAGYLPARSSPSVEPSRCVWEPAYDLDLGEEAASFDLVGGQLAASGEAVDLLRLAAEDGGELVDCEEDR
jgi:hypothetical protein